ncbi:hypothetical protein BDW22DRAFT_1429836 [Trametopsis cervina]|nr:hypothetical protein BDW22DRAFT_1429836 [Trametopsis cervina]
MSQPLVSIKASLGPFLVLVCGACILFGVFVTQTFYYWITYPNDGRKLRIFIFALWLLEAVHTGFCIHIIYYYFVSHFTDSSAVNNIVWSVGAAFVCEVIIVTCSEGFYIRLSEKKIYVVALPGLLLLSRAGLGLFTVVMFYKTRFWDVYEGRRIVTVSLNAEYSLGLLADCSITGLLIWYLCRKRTAYAQTNMKIQKLMYYTLNTGGVTLITSALIIAACNKQWQVGNQTSYGLLKIASKLYSNSMLAMLNARKYVSEVGGKNDMAEFGNIMELPRIGAHASDNRIKIITETVVTTDHDTPNGTHTPSDTAYAYDIRKVQTDVLTEP